MSTNCLQLPHIRCFSESTCASDGVGLGVRGTSSSRTTTTAGFLSLFSSTDALVLPGRTGVGAANGGEKPPSELELDGGGVEEEECRPISGAVSVDIDIVERL